MSWLGVTFDADVFNIGSGSAEMNDCESNNRYLPRIQMTQAVFPLSLRVCH